VILREDLERYIIISGFRRIHALRILGKDKVDARIFGRSELTEEQALRITFLDNLTARGFNEMEKAIVLERFKKICHFSTDELVKIARQMNLQGSLQVIKNYIQFCDFGDEIKQWIAVGRLDPRIIFLLLKFKKEDQTVIFEEIFKTLEPSTGEANEILNLILDITMKHQASVSELIKRMALNEIISKDEARHIKVDRLRKRLRQIRYPLLSEKDQRFRSLVGSCGNLRGIKIDPPSYFEGAHLTISFETKDIIDLRLKLEALKDAVLSGHIPSLFALLRETKLLSKQ
jgi:hypothetical protein